MDVRSPVLRSHGQTAFKIERLGPVREDPAPEISDEGERLDPAKAQAVDQAGTNKDFLQPYVQARKGPVRSDGPSAPAPVAQGLQPAGQSSFLAAKSP